MDNSKVGEHNGMVAVIASKSPRKALYNSRLGHGMRKALIQHPQMLLVDGLGTPQLLLDEDEGMDLRLGLEQGIETRDGSLRNVFGSFPKYLFEIDNSLEVE